MMGWSALWGMATLLSGIALSCIGLPSQIWKDYREKRSGQPFFLLLLILAVFLFRIGYAVTIQSWYLLVPDFIGTGTTLILIYQYWLYRKPGIERTLS